MSRLRLTVVGLVIAAWASPGLAIDLRSELIGRDVIRRVSYEWEQAPPVPVASPEEIIVDPIGDGIVESRLAPSLGHGSCGPGGCGPASCGPGGCGPRGCPPGCGCTLCCAGPCWLGVEFLNWWHHSSVAPALVTDGPLPTNNVFSGRERLFNDARVGMRLSLGWWAEPCNQWGLLGRWYLLEDSEYDFNQTSNGVAPILSRPFFNLSVDAMDQIIGDDALDIANGNVGSVRVHGVSSLQGGDLLCRYVVQDTARASIDVLCGYNVALIDEDLSIRSVSTVNAADLVLVDEFSTQNRFHAATFGFLCQAHFETLSLEMLGKVAMGNMAQTARVAGSFDGAPNGLLAQQNNSGTFSQDVFAVAPEVGLNLIYRPTPCLDINFGYSFLYWSSVAQATELIDPLLRVSPNNPPVGNDLPQPGFEFRNSDLVVHGLNLGLRFSY